MWITGDVDLPQPIVDAHTAGRLVFFIGAGASMDPPANLPNFRGLVRDLAHLAKVHFDEDRDDFDTFLGEMPENFDTHAHARELIARRGSTPNSTHRALVRVAASAGPLRIVTTNFDDHLATAAANEGIEIPDRWSGPALPLGHDFVGLVHLHGSVLRAPRELVLTDTDFGKAYLTSAWATRFLLPMFQEHTVIFVGYGHNDPIMKYLALGLPSKTQRYAFTLADEAGDPKWERLHVTTIGYPGSKADHSALVAALEAWETRVRMGRTDHEARMVEVVEAGATLTPVDRAYLAERLTTVDGTRQFAAATGGLDPNAQVGWLRWAEDVPDFKAAFAGADGDDSASILVNWFCQSFVASPQLNGAALQTVQRLGQVFSPGLFRGASWAAQRLGKSDAVAATRWKALLASSIHGHSVADPMDWLVSPFGDEFPEHVAVLRAALRPYLVLKQRWFLSEAEAWATPPDAHVTWHSEPESLTQHLRHLVDVTEPGEPTLGTLLEDPLLAAYDLLEAYHGVREWDSLGYGRSAIEQHQQDHFREPPDPLIDALRAYGEKGLGVRPDLPERWWSLRRCLFRRLALHLVAVDEARAPDAKITWLLDRAVLYETELKHEVYQVLKAAADPATETARGRLLAAVEAGPDLPADTSDLDRHVAYGTYNLLVWLTTVAPDWPEAAEALEVVQAANPDFAPRENPDFDSWISINEGLQSLAIEPEDFARAFSEDPERALDDLLGREYSDHPIDGPQWADALALIRRVVAMQPVLGERLWRHVGARTDQGTRLADLRRAITEGWADSDLGESVDAAVVRVGELVASSESARSVSRFLLEQIGRQIESPETAALGAMRKIATDLWDQQGDTFRHREGIDPVDLAPLYLNSWPGDLVRYWMSEVDRRWRSDRADWSGLNDQERGALEAMLQGPPDALDATRPALASGVFFMFAADADFTTSHVLPLFREEATARLAWSPYLHHPRYNDRLLAAGLLDSLIAEWDRIDTLGPDRLSQQFLGLVASIVSFAGIPPAARQQLLDKSVLAAGGSYASAFAGAVVHQLADARVDGTELWSRWLRDHLIARLNGVPRTAEPDELERWCDTVPRLGDAIPEALAMLNGRGIGLGERFRSAEMSDVTLAAYGAALAGHYAERVRHSSPTGFLLQHNVRKLIEAFRTALGEEAAQPIVAAARERGFVVDGGF